MKTKKKSNEKIKHKITETIQIDLSKVHEEKHIIYIHLFRKMLKNNSLEDILKLLNIIEKKYGCENVFTSNKTDDITIININPNYNFKKIK